MDPHDHLEKMRTRVFGILKSRAPRASYSDIEDATQEALIKAWQDTESEKYTPQHVFNRALQNAWAHLDPHGHRQPTGHERRQSHGRTAIATNEKRTRIAEFCETYRTEHATTPTHREIAEALGLNRKDVSALISQGLYLRFIPQGVREETSPIAQAASWEAHCEEMAVSGQEPHAQPLEGHSTYQTNPEHIVMQRAHLSELLGHTTPNKAVAVYRFYVEGFTQGTIATELGLNGRCAAERLIRAAIQEIREGMTHVSSDALSEAGGVERIVGEREARGAGTVPGEAGGVTDGVAGVVADGEAVLLQGRNADVGRGGDTHSARTSLTEKEVQKIRDAFAGGARQADLAREFDVSRQNINNIIMRRTWQHV